MKELIWRTSTGAEFISLTITAVMSFHVSLCICSLVKPAVPSPVKVRVRSLLFLLHRGVRGTCYMRDETCRYPFSYT